MELLEALKTIRETCSKQSKCRECPLRSKTDVDHCAFVDNVENPEDWTLFGDGEDATPRLIR